MKKKMEEAEGLRIEVLGWNNSHPYIRVPHTSHINLASKPSYQKYTEQHFAYLTFSVSNLNDVSRVDSKEILTFKTWVN